MDASNDQQTSVNTEEQVQEVTEVSTTENTEVEQVDQSGEETGASETPKEEVVGEEEAPQQVPLT